MQNLIADCADCADSCTIRTNTEMCRTAINPYWCYQSQRESGIYTNSLNLLFILALNLRPAKNDRCAINNNALHSLFSLNSIAKNAMFPHIFIKRRSDEIDSVKDIPSHNRLPWAQFLHWQKNEGRVAYRKINQNRIKYSGRDRNSGNGVESSRKLEEIVLSPQPQLISHRIISHHSTALPKYLCLMSSALGARTCMYADEYGTSDLIYTLNTRCARSAHSFGVETCVLHEWIA